MLYLALKLIIMASKNWVVDPTHSEVKFKIKHLMITNVTGDIVNFFPFLRAKKLRSRHNFDI